MKYLLIEHRIGEGGSVTEGKGYGILPDPLQIIQELDPVPPAYRDISTIYNWYSFGFELDKDFIFVRNRIVDAALGLLQLNEPTAPTQNDSYLLPDGKTAAVFDGKSWTETDAVSVAYTKAAIRDRELLMRLNIGDEADLVRDFGQEEVRKWKLDYHERNSKARAKRIQQAEALIQSELRPYQSIIMLTITSLVTELDLGTGPALYSIDLHKNYKEFSVFSTWADYSLINNPQPAVGIGDYIKGTALFEGKGLIDMPWQPTTFKDMATLGDRLVQILNE